MSVTAFLTKKITKDESRATGMAVVLLLLIVSLTTKRTGFIGAAIVLQVVTMTAPKIYRPAAVLWLGFSDLLGTVVSKILLSAVFLLVVVPVGIVRRWSGKDSLNLQRFKSGQTSVMVERDHLFTAKDLEKPY